MHRLRRVLIVTHRWLGILGAALFVAWFASGIVMMYTRTPRLTDKERLAEFAGRVADAAVRLIGRNL